MREHARSDWHRGGVLGKETSCTAVHSGFWCIVFVVDKLAHFDAKDVTLLSVT